MILLDLTRYVFYGLFSLVVLILTLILIVALLWLLRIALMWFFDVDYVLEWKSWLDKLKEMVK